MTTYLPLSLRRILSIACYLMGAMAAILMARPVVAQQPAFLTNGLVAYYPFNGNTRDYSDTHITETSQNISYSTNRFGTQSASGYFNGTSSSIVFDSNSSSLFNTLPLTVSVWVKIGTDYGWDIPIVSKYYQASANGWSLGVNASYILSWYYGSIGNVNSDDQLGLRSAPQGLSNWKHAVCVFDELGGTLYLNGTIVTNSGWTGSPSIPTSAMPVTIGMGIYSDNTGARFFKGLIDDLRIYNRALSEAEVKSLYTYESMPPQPVIITSQPTSIITDLGKDVSFSVSATNALTYQWFKDGRILKGETNSAIQINYAQFHQTGSYKVVVSNEAGSIESESAKLTLRGGRVVAWGGNNTHGSTTVPAGLEDVVAVSAGYYHSLALKSDGTVVAWGANWDGRSEVPKGLSNIVSIFTPSGYSFAVDRTGNLYQWGSNFANNTSFKSFLITSNVLSMAVGDGLLLLNQDSTILEFQHNLTSPLSTPRGLVDIIDIAGDSGLSIAVKRDGTVMAWGYQDWNRTSVPPDLKSVRRVSTRGRHSLALRSDGTVAAWGMSDFGAISVPNNLSRVISVAAGSWHSLALRDDNTVVAWGDNRDGQCDIPKGLKGVIAISAGEGHNLAIVSDSLFPPVIKQNITSLNVDSGQSAEFKIEARNVNSYQWFKDGNALPGATNAILSLTNARPTLIGDYFAVVSNTYGTATSSVASFNIKGVDSGIWKGLVVWYPFDGNSQDASGNNFHGQTHQSTLTKNRFGVDKSAYNFNGVSSEITALNINKIKTGELTLTYSCWVNKDTGYTSPNGGQVVVGLGRGANGRADMAFFDDTFGGMHLMYIGGWNDYMWKYSGDSFEDKWQHLVFVKNGANIYFYINGRLVSQSALEAGQFIDRLDLHIGGSGVDTEFFKGDIDDVRVYNRALSASEVKSVYDYESIPPVLILSSPSSVNVDHSAEVNFSLVATNALAYQWFKDGNALPSATNAILSLTNARPALIGDYYAVARNDYGSATSSVASLNINGVDARIWKGLVAWYTFDNKYLDESLNQRDPLEVKANFGSDRFGNKKSAVQFSGDSDSISYSCEGLPLGTNPKTMSLWIKVAGLNKSGDSHILGYGGAETGRMFGFFVDPEGYIKFFGYFSDLQILSQISVPSEWINLVATYSENRINVWANGKIMNTANMALNTDSTGFTIGTYYSSPKNSHFNGSVDDVRIYNRALSEYEVKALYESERVPDTIIVNQPQAVALAAGANATFSVTATNSSSLVSLTYQWQKDGNPISGATNSLLAITNVQPVNIGDYNVVVSGGFQAVTSASASLNIEGVNSGIWRGLVAWLPLDGNAVDVLGRNPSGVLSDVVYRSNRFGIPMNAVGFGGITSSRIEFESGIIPRETNFFTVSFWVEHRIEKGKIGSYLVTGSDTSKVYTSFFSLWDWALRPGLQFFSENKYHGGISAYQLNPGFDYFSGWQQIVLVFDPKKAATLYVNGKKLPDFGAQLSKDLDNVANAVFGAGVLKLGENLAGSMDDFRVYNRLLSAAEVTALYQSERVPDSVIIRQPQSAAVAVGGSVQLEVEASNPIPTVQFAYQWLKDGSKLVGATNSTLNLGQLRPEQIGTYTVTVDDGSRTLTSTAANVSLQGVDSSIWKGLVASYTFEGDFSDSSGFGDSLVPYGVVNFVDQGRRPETKVARVTGLDGFLVGPERAWFSGVQPRTVSVWIKPEATATNVSTVLTLGGLENCAQRFSLQVPVAQNGIRFDGGDCTNGLRSKTFTGASISGKWTHAVLTYDGSSVRCYVNGLVSGTAYTVALNTDPIAPLVIGNTVGLDSEGFTGLVDDVRIYNRSLSATEVRALFNYESTGVAPSLPQITQQPTPVSGYEGETLKLSVEATGYQLGYQWQRGGQNLASDVRLSGINNSELQVKGARLDDGGDYRVLVTNSFGAVTSSMVKLTVAPPVRSLVAGLANEVQEGQRMTFPLSMVSTGDVGGLTFKLSYNPAFLTDPKVEWSAVVGQSVNTVNTSVAGEISGSFSLAGTALVSGTAALGTVDFRARSVPAQTNVVLSPAVVSVANPSGTLLAAGNGAIAGEGRIRPRKIKGDNNANQRIDIGDAVVVSKLLVGLEETRSWDVGLNDLNASQSLDNGDVIKALRTVVGLDPQPSPGSEGKRLAMALGFAKVLVNTNDAMAIELLDGPKATVGQPYRVAVRLNRVKGSLSGLSFALKYPASLSLTDKQVGALVPGDALPFWNESAGQISLAAIRSTAWANATGVAAVLTFVPSAGFSAQAEWPLKLEQVEITGSGFDVRPVDPVSVAIQSGGGTVNTPPQIALQPPAADGSLTLEIRAPAGATVAIEATGDLNTWVESQRITGQGDSTPVKVTLKPDPTVQAKFWRLRVR